MIAALVLAAGLSARMGTPKQVLPWGKTTVVQHIVHTLETSRVVDEIVVVTGQAHAEVCVALRETPARCVLNPAYANGDMLHSVQVGLHAALSAEAILLTLGDQPQLEAHVVQTVVARWRQAQALIVAPSYQRRRGHPWLLASALYPALLALSAPYTLRDFLNTQAPHIAYVNVETDTILRDLDTPTDYERERPQ